MFIDAKDLIITDESNKIKDDVICIVCLNIILKPIECSICHHSFCSDCVLQLKENQFKFQCPFKCKNVTFVKSESTLKLLNKLTFKCKLNCGEQIQYNDYFTHSQYLCKKINAKEKLQRYLEHIKELNRTRKEKINTLQKLSTNSKNKDNKSLYTSLITKHPRYQTKFGNGNRDAAHVCQSYYHY